MVKLRVHRSPLFSAIAMLGLRITMHYGLLPARDMLISYSTGSIKASMIIAAAAIPVAGSHLHWFQPVLSQRNWFPISL